MLKYLHSQRAGFKWPTTALFILLRFSHGCENLSKMQELIVENNHYLQQIPRPLQHKGSFKFPLKSRISKWHGYIFTGSIDETSLHIYW